MNIRLPFLYQFLCTALFSLFLIGNLSAQTLNKMRFSVTSFSYLQAAFLGEGDEVNVDVADRGIWVSDVGFNIDPSKSTALTLIMRGAQSFRSNDILTAIRFRQMLFNGLIGKNFLYSVGGFDYEMTPFTLYATEEDGLFGANNFIKYHQKISRYNAQYFGNQRRLRGFKINYKKDFKRIPAFDHINVEAFFTRMRSSINANARLTNQLAAGGRIKLQQSKKLKVNINNTNFFTIPTAVTERLISNNLYGADFDVNLSAGIWNYGFNGELSLSQLSYKNDVSAPGLRRDYAINLGFRIGTSKETFKAGATYLNVGPQFYSIMAQSRTVNLGNRLYFFRVINNARITRRVSILDLGIDANIYFPTLSESLMRYDPRYANTLPYGLSTPNRNTIIFNVEAKDYLEKVKVKSRTTSSKEISSLTFSNKKSFLLTQLDLDVNVHNILQWSKVIQLSFGGQYEKTTRNDGENGGEAVELKTMISSVGVDIEFIKRLHFVMGSLYLTSNGNERLYEYDNFNNVVELNPTNELIDESQSVFNTGIEYRVNENTYLMVNYLQFRYADNTFTDNNTHKMNMLSILFNVNL